MLTANVSNDKNSSKKARINIPFGLQSRFLAVQGDTGCPTHLRLETPIDIITAEAWGLGCIELDTSEDGSAIVRIDCLHPSVGLSLPDGVRLKKLQ